MRRFFFTVALLFACSLLAQSPGMGQVIAAHKKDKRIFISTDSFPGGRPIEIARAIGFEQIHAIDFSLKDHLAAIAKFQFDPQIQLYHRDSPPLLKAILSSIQEPIVIWLNTFHKNDLFIWGERVDEKTPLLRELAILGQHPIKTHTILIGDIQLLGTSVFNHLTFDQLVQAIQQINPEYEIFTEDDGRILVATSEGKRASPEPTYEQAARSAIPPIHGRVSRAISYSGRSTASLPDEESPSFQEGVLQSPAVYADAQVIYTSALLEKHIEVRQLEYLRSLNALKNYGLDPYIVEATHVDHSFYEAHSDRVFYPHQNRYSKNIGANELLSIRACFPFFPFADEDIVIKLTGRYWLFQPTLLDVIRNNPGYDVYLKKWFGTGWFEFTGCFAMKWKHFKNMLEAVDTDKMDAETIDFEVIVARYVEENQLRVFRLGKFDILARINGIDETHAY